MKTRSMNALMCYLLAIVWCVCVCWLCKECHDCFKKLATGMVGREANFGMPHELLLGLLYRLMTCSIRALNNFKARDDNRRYTYSPPFSQCQPYARLVLASGQSYLVKNHSRNRFTATRSMTYHPRSARVPPVPSPARLRNSNPNARNVKSMRMMSRARTVVV